MDSHKLVDNFEDIIIARTPLIDVRAPIEYEKGAFPNAANLPLMDNEERHLVGIKYKNEGNIAAVKLGHELVNGDYKASKINKWISYFKEHPDTIIYCFRGGQRSQISQEWIEEALGHEIPRIKGGYKAFRHFFLNFFEQPPTYEPIRLGGMTGCGKTLLLKELANQVKGIIDLEGIAHHRGSAFGSFIDAQPSQINFEHQLGYELIPLVNQGIKHLVIEDEGKNVGRCFLPKSLSSFWNQGSLILLEASPELRVSITLEEYVIDAQANYMNIYGEEQGFLEWQQDIIQKIHKIQSRLGGVNHKAALEMFKTSCKEQIQTGNFEVHNTWISDLLFNYYDPMYNYQIDNNKEHIIFRGDYKSVSDYIIDLLKDK